MNALGINAVVHDAAAAAGAARAPGTVLILRAFGLGDLLTAVPALRALAGEYPEHRRVLAAPIALAPLMPLIRTEPDGAGGGGPAVNAVLDVTAVGRRPALPRAIAPPEVAVNLHGRGPESHVALLRTRPHRLLAFAHPAVPASVAGAHWRAGEREPRRWCRMLGAYGIPAQPDDLEIAAPVDATPEGAEQATVVHPGANSPGRRWPVRRWAAVARAERRAGRRVLVTGGPAELTLARAVGEAAGLPGRAVLAGRTDTLQLTALVAGAARVVCGDTGMAHLATALRTPSVVLFGPTPPSEWGTPEDRPGHRALWAGGLGDPHAGQPDQGLLKIGSGDVVAALAELPETPVPAARLAEVTR